MVVSQVSGCFSKCKAADVEFLQTLNFAWFCWLMDFWPISSTFHLFRIGLSIAEGKTGSLKWNGRVPYCRTCL